MTDLQQAILEFVWSRGSVSAEQVREGLLPKYPLKDSSIRTLLRRLENHGYLSHTVTGRTFVYTAAAPASSAAVRAVRQLIDRFWSGSAEEFVAGMVEAEVISPETLERLAVRIKDMK